MRVQARRPVALLEPLCLGLYLLGLFVSVPLSLLVWFVRRELVREKGVAGEQAPRPSAAPSPCTTSTSPPCWSSSCTPSSGTAAPTAATSR